MRDEMRESLESAMDAALTDEALAPTKNALQKFFDEFHAEFEDRVRSYMSYNFARHVEDMAAKAITAMLEGNEDEMRLRLSCVEGGWNGRDRDHPVIHGKLFEQGCILLRKQIVDANTELLKEQRILDLEDQLASVVKQNNKLEREKNEMWERVREYLPR